MSVRVMTAVWDNGPVNHIDRYVLLCIADSANDDGHGYPSVETIAKKTQLNKRTVMRSIQSLEADEWISVHRKSRKVKYSTYDILLERFKKSGDRESPEKSSMSGDSGDMSQVTLATESGDSHDTGPHTPNKEEPSINHQYHPPAKPVSELLGFECYRLYPKQRSPAAGISAFVKCIDNLVAAKRFPHATAAGYWLMERVKLFAASPSVQGVNPRFVSRADRWVAEGRYDEDVTTWLTVTMPRFENANFEDERAQLARII